MSKSDIVEFVQLVVEGRLRETQLTDGTTVEWGSERHLAELERQLAEIQHKVQSSPRGSSRRADFKRAGSRIREELKSARRHAERRQLQEKLTEGE